MVQRRMTKASNFVGDALASLGIGIWSWRGAPTAVHCCPVAAGIFGVPATAAWEGLPLDSYVVRVHPEDRTRFTELISQAQRTGGAFVAEYRTLDEAGETHSVLDRGEFELGLDGYAVAARGVVVDLTGRPIGMEIERDAPGLLSIADLPPLDRAVEHALALHGLISVLPEEKRPLAEMLLGTVLEMLGQEVAASLERIGYRSVHLQGGAH